MAQPRNNNRRAQQVNQPAPLAVNPVSRIPFTGSDPNQIVVRNNLGSEAEQLIIAKYPHLRNAKKLDIHKTKAHPHPYCAFAREMFENVIISSYAANETIIDFHASNRNQYKNRWTNGADAPRHETIHSMAFELDVTDNVRHKEWTRSLRQHTNAGLPLLTATTYHTLAKNVCAHKPYRVDGQVKVPHTLCTCVHPTRNQPWVDNSVVMAIDIFQDRVMQKVLLNHLKTHPESTLYYTAFDFSKICKTKEEITLPDDEGVVSFTRGDTFEYTMQIKGNLGAYQGPVLDFRGEGWQFEDLDTVYLFKVIDRMPFGECDYALVQVNVVPSTLACVANLRNLTLHVEQEQDSFLPIFEIIGKTVKNVQVLFEQVDRFIDTSAKAGAAVKYIKEWIQDSNKDEDGYYYPTRVKYDSKNDLLHLTVTIQEADNEFTYRELLIVPELLVEKIPAMLARHNASEFVNQYRSTLSTNAKIDARINPITIGDTLTFAQIVTVRMLNRYASIINNQETDNLRHALGGKKHEKNYTTKAKKYLYHKLFNLVTLFWGAGVHAWQWKYLIAMFVISLITVLRAGGYVHNTSISPFLGVDAFQIPTWISKTQEMREIAHLYEDSGHYGTESMTNMALTFNVTQNDCVATLLYSDYLVRFATVAEYVTFWEFTGFMTCSFEIFTTMCIMCIVSWYTFYRMIKTWSFWPAIWYMYYYTVIQLMYVALSMVLNRISVAAMDGRFIKENTNYAAATALALTARQMWKRREFLRVRNGFKAFSSERNGEAKPKPQTKRQIRKLYAINMKWALQGKLFFIICLFVFATPCVQAKQTIPPQTNYGLIASLFMLLIIIAIMLVRLFVDRFYPGVERIWVEAGCVLDDDRLDFASLPEEAKRSLKIKGKMFDKNDTPQVIRQKVGCKQAGKAYAGQIGPFIRGNIRRLPTIKHPCDLTTLAALKRGMEAVTIQHPDFEKDIKKSFKEVGLEVKRYITAQGGMNVSLERWLSRHPEAYRDKIRRSVAQFWNRSKSCIYSVFPKVEMQITEVLPEDMNTKNNALKERCIFGPDDYKKAMTGPFMNELEQLLHQHMKVYCGSKDWPQICDLLQKMIELFWKLCCKIVFVEADFSRYDSTQREFILTQFTEMMLDIAEHPLIEWELDQDKEELKHFLRESIAIQLQAFMGGVSARVFSRASGDTWTTVGNTLTSIALWSAVLRREGFNPRLDGISGKTKPVFMMMKGDDMIGMICEKDLPAFEDAVRKGFNKDNKATPHGVGPIVKIVESGPLDERSYLSNYFFQRSDGSFRMMRKPDRVFMTLPFSTKIFSSMKNLDQLSRELLFAKGQCLLAWGEGLPIWDVLARKLIQLGTPCEFEIGYADKARICRNVLSNDWQDAAAWFWKKYRLGYWELKEIERKISEITELTGEVVISELDVFFKDQ